MSRDYSAKPLSDKLGAKPGTEVVVFFTTAWPSWSVGSLRSETIAGDDGL